MITVHYFASVREAVSTDREELELPDNVNSVADLIDFLSGQHSGLSATDGEGNPLLVAVNQTVVDQSYTLSDNDEVAFFPPMTGG